MAKTKIKVGMRVDVKAALSDEYPAYDRDLEETSHIHVNPEMKKLCGTTQTVEKVIPSRNVFRLEGCKYFFTEDMVTEHEAEKIVLIVDGKNIDLRHYKGRKLEHKKSCGYYAACEKKTFPEWAGDAVRDNLQAGGWCGLMRAKKTGGDAIYLPPLYHVTPGKVYRVDRGIWHDDVGLEFDMGGRKPEYYSDAPNVRFESVTGNPAAKHDIRIAVCVKGNSPFRVGRSYIMIDNQVVTHGGDTRADVEMSAGGNLWHTLDTPATFVIAQEVEL